MSTPPAGFNQAPNPAKQGFLRRKLSRRTRIWLSVGALALGVAFALFVQIFISPNDATHAKAGDCVRNDGSSTEPNVYILSCSDAGATFKVLQTMNSSNMKDCDSVAGNVAEYVQTYKDKEFSDLLLCLGSNPH